ncbi:MAG: hypothetical protein H7Z10_00935 [Gemmatimonadaceae bacterium]|nr:hypothetical protein [Acetobacteraceae bacterium]
MDPITPLLVLHCFGLALGLGGATILDVILLRSLRHTVEAANIRLFETIASLVSMALALLWLSGLGFLAIYAWRSPAMLENPKLWAKIVVVGILTANGAVLHAKILPILRAQAGRTVFDGLPPRTRVWMLTAGAVSVVSWYYPFLLGIVRELNFAASVATFLLAYAASLAAAWMLVQATATWIAAAEANTRNSAPTA